MNKSTGSGRDDRWRGRPEEEAVRHLMAEAGPLSPVPKDDLAAIEVAARRAWKQRYGRSRGYGWLRLAAVLAVGSVSLAALLWWWSGLPVPGAAVVATVERTTGSVQLLTAEAGTEGVVSAAAGGLVGGTVVETSGGARGGRAALRLAAGASLRLDHGTRLRLITAGEVELLAGAVYVDGDRSDPEGAGALAVRTAAGTFRDVGTQFEVRLMGGDVGPGSEAGVRLRVREGRVLWLRGDAPAVATAGQELYLGADGNLSQGTVAPDGPGWDWVLAAAPRLAIEGVTVRTFLDWVTREAGWRLRFADGEVEAASETIVLHGTIDHLSPTEAPAVVLPSCGLGHRVEGGTLVVFLDDGAAP